MYNAESEEKEDFLLLISLENQHQFLLIEKFTKWEYKKDIIL